MTIATVLVTKKQIDKLINQCTKLSSEQWKKLSALIGKDQVDGCELCDDTEFMIKEFHKDGEFTFHMWF